MKSADLGMQLLDNVPAFYYGTSPNKFFDYIAAGLPVLNNYTGWLADMIKKNECGFVVPPEEPQTFADSLQKAASDKNVLKSMGKKSYILAKNQFDRHNLAADWVKWVTGAAK
jgi:glycosyltransferase involved in cell wall biosynthesis